MVDKPEEKAVEQAAKPTDTPADKPADGKKAPKPKKTWSNPALRAMGIPRFSLPSRNWMIFWTVLTSVGGGIAYDKYQQKQIRKRYMDQVEYLSKEVYTSERVPRKLTVFIAPPPDDFLDESLRYFRKYVKPIFNSAALDFDVFSAQRQGDIRTAVSEKVRSLRRERLQIAPEAQKDNSWKKFITTDIPSILASPFKRKKTEPEELKSYQELYSPKDVLGLYRIAEPIQTVRDDSLDITNTGGVVCVGRGAYKEYMQGLHEGLLGPLEKPVPTPEEIQEQEEAEKKRLENEEPPEEPEANPVVKPFIKPEDYAKAAFAPEFDPKQVVRDKNQVPVLFEQPVYVYMIPNLVGFSNIPKKIYRYFIKRYVAEDFAEKTLAIIYNKQRPFEYKDQFAAKEEELLWPKNWVQTGKERGAEWVQELVVDDRVTSRMRVIDPELK